MGQTQDLQLSNLVVFRQQNYFVRFRGKKIHGLGSNKPFHARIEEAKCTS